MPLIKSKSKKAFSENVKKEMDAGKPQPQSLAIAYSVKRKAGAKKKMADGGSPSPSPSPDMSSSDSSPTPLQQGMASAFGDMYGQKGKSKKAEGGMIDMPDEKITADSITPEEMEMIKSYRRKKMYDGGEVLNADAMPPHGEDMLDSHPVEGAPEANFHDAKMQAIDDARTKREMEMMHERRMKDGGEIDMRKESMSMNSIDEAADDRDEMMLDSHPTRHKDEIRAASGMPDADNEETSVAEAIMRRKKMAEGGEVDLSRNADEDRNEEDQMSYNALRKENYSESDGLEDLDYDTDRSVGDDLEDEDEHDMVGKIRAKYSKKR